MPKRKDDELERALAAAMAEEALLPPGEGSLLVVATPSDLCANLRSYGELTVADRALGASQPELQRIYKRAAELGPLVANDCKALALAAVEVFEGRPRPLARKRRLPSTCT